MEDALRIQFINIVNLHIHDEMHAYDIWISLDHTHGDSLGLKKITLSNTG